jgi:hypothetical protein
MANDGDLKCIFQYDSDGIRALATKGGVDTFDDLVAYVSLYRPSTLQCVAINTTVRTQNGLKQIQFLESGLDSIAYVNTYGNISHTKNFLVLKTGKKKIYRIKTKSGKTLLVSAEHPILNKSNKFVQAKDLEIGDEITII